MERFHVIDDAAVILRSRGNFRQAKVFRCGVDVYGQWGGGYIRLLGSQGTSNPNVSWVDLEAEGVELTSMSKTPKFTASAPVQAVG